MSWDNNPYYHPEVHGLVKVDEAYLSEPDYSFDILAVWADADGFYLGTDSGCSCPSPFEDYQGRGDMTGPLTVDQAIEEATSLRGTSTYDQPAWDDFLSQIRSHEPA
jgi:hypothetical protein